MAQKSSDYLIKRFEQLESESNKLAGTTLPEIEQQYRLAERQIQAQINAWYGRFATNNNVSLQDARKLLNANELAELKWDIAEYIKYGQDNMINGAWMKQLENASARHHISRLEALKLQTQQSAEVMFGNQLDSIDGLMRSVYTDNFYHSAFEIQRGIGVGWNIAAIDNNRLNKIINKPWTADGKNFSDRIWNNKSKLINELHTELTQMCILGKAPDQAVRNIARKLNTSKSNAGRLVMTESAYFASASQKDCFNELGVEKYQIIATLDAVTSQICQELDLMIFDMKDYQVGVTAPPFHVRCRTTTAPYFDDDFGERAARDHAGKTVYVPSTMKYLEWKKTFVDNLQDVSKSSKMNNSWLGLNYKSSYTKKEAIDRLENKYGIGFSDSRKYPINGDLLNDCVGWVDSFSEQYPEFMRNNPCKIPIIANYPPNKMKNAVGYYSYYSNNPLVVELALNGQYHSNLKGFGEYVERCIKSKWYPANATVHKTFVHEYGHHISNSMRHLAGNVNWQSDFINECIEEFNINNTSSKINTFKDTGDLVSIYGSTSNSELFAEAFAEYFGGEDPREFAVIFGNKLDSILKGVK